MRRAPREELKKLIGNLIAESDNIRAQAQAQPPEFAAWTLRVELVGEQVGGAFQRRIAEVLDPENDSLYWARIREHNSRARRVGSGDFPNAIRYEWIVDNAVGLLHGVVQAVDDRLLDSLEDRVASELYSDVLAEASAAQQAGKADIAAILMRVALENGLRRLARREGMPDVDGATASAVNVWLWKDGQTFPAGTHRAVEGWLAIGNAFVHPSDESNKYTHAQIAKAINDVRGFLGSHGL